MKRSTENASKPKATQFRGQRPPLTKRVFSFVNYKKAHEKKGHEGKTKGAVGEDLVEAAPRRPRVSWQGDIEGLVPITVLNSNSQANTAMRSEENLRFCATVIGVFVLLFGLITVISALTHDASFPLLRARCSESTRIPAATHTPATVYRPREAVHSELTEESSGKHVSLLTIS
ncbi:hypothetical protein MRX96_040283 [Rhipicephalus microplus]